MKTQILTLISLVAFLHCNAQIQLTAFHTYDAGTSATYTIDPTEQDLLNDGENQVWDASLTSGIEATNDFVEVFDTPFSFNYPDANVAVTADGFYAYFEGSSDELINHGFVFQGALSCIYTDPIVQAQYPMSFGDSYTDDFVGELTILADESMASRYGDIEVTADAYGDIILPYATIENTIRIKTVINVTDSLNGQAFSGIETSYFWYDSEYGNVLASYVITENIGAPAQYSFVYVSESDYLSINETLVDSDIVVYPNPANEFIQISGLTTSTDYVITNQQGQEVLSGITNGSERIYTSELSAGVYFIEISSKNEAIRKKILID